MTSRTLIGRVLIIGPVGMLVAWFAWGFSIGNPDSGDHAAMLTAISTNAGITKWLMGVVAFFMFLFVAGMVGLTKSMSGGSGSDYAYIGVIIFVMSAAFGLGEIALRITAADLGAANQPTTAFPIYMASYGIGAISTAGIFLGLAAIGLGVIVQKNFNPIIGYVLTAGSIVCVGLALYDYGSQLLTIGILAIFSVVAMGVSTLRSSD